MKAKFNLCIVSFFTVCLVVCPVIGQVSLTPDTVITFLKTTTPPNIDGVLDPIWENVTEFAIDHSVVLNPDKRDPTDENDYSGSFRAMWDDDFFYTFFNIVDDTLFRDDINDKIFRDDCIELYFDGNNSKESTYDGIDDWQIQISYDDPLTSFHIGSKSPNTDLDISDFANHAILINDEGWTLEIAIIWGMLNIGPVDNQKIGVEYDYDDDDDGGVNEHKIKAFADSTDDTWKNASVMGTAILSGELVATAVEDQNYSYPEILELRQNFPNPFNPTTEIVYSVPRKDLVTLDVYNLLGEKVANLINNQIENAGYHKVQFNGAQLNSGIYLYKIQTGSNVLTKKMMLLK